MSVVLLAIGLVFVVEGLVIALAPSRIEDLLAALQSITVEQRRAIGLGALALGVAMVWISRALGG